MERLRQTLVILLIALSCAAVAIGIEGELEAIRWERSMKAATASLLDGLNHNVNAGWVTLDRANRLLTTTNEQVKGIGAHADEVSAALLRTNQDLQLRIQHPLGNLKETK
jgi:hypothetical protein